MSIHDSKSRLCLLPCVAIVLILAASGCRPATKPLNLATPAPLLPRERVIALGVVQETLPEMKQEKATGHDETAVGSPTGTRSVTYATADGSQRVVISVDQYARAELAAAAYQTAFQASQAVPGAKGEPVPDLGERAFIGIATQGKETHVGGGALFGDKIVTVTLQGYDGTKENQTKVATLIRRQAGVKTGS